MLVNNTTATTSHGSHITQEHNFMSQRGNPTEFAHAHAQSTGFPKVGRAIARIRPRCLPIMTTSSFAGILHPSRLRSPVWVSRGCQGPKTGQALTHPIHKTMPLIPSL